MKQIPATVVDTGVFKFVPYVSFRCGEDYELNIYGDLDKPASIEIGVYRQLLSDESAKENCMKYMEAVLSDPADREVLKTLNRKKGIVTRGAVTFEITPPTAEDAYLGWWVSVYNEKRLSLARASESELQQISVAKTTVASNSTNSQDGLNWAAKELKFARPSTAYRPQAYSLRRASNPQPSVTPTPYSPPTHSYGRTSVTPTYSSGGSVYVRGYTRKDGTYVPPHTRSTPRR